MRKLCVIAAGLLLVTVLCGQFIRAAETNSENLLLHAEHIGSIDSVELDRILQQLQPRSAELSPVQQQQYRLLQIEQAVHRGQTALATQALAEFNSVQQPMALRYRAQLLNARTAMTAQQYHNAFRHLLSALQDYALIRQPRLQAAALLLAVEFYTLADMKDEAQQHQQLLASLVDAKLEQCHAAYLQASFFDRQQLAQATLINPTVIAHCRQNKLSLQADTLQWFNHRILLASHKVNPSKTQLNPNPQVINIDGQLWHLAHALSLQHLTAASRVSSELLNQPTEAMNIQQRLDLLHLRLALLTQQQQLPEVVLVQQKIYELAQMLQSQQATLKLAAQTAIYDVRQKHDQLRLLAEELKASGLESQLKQQLVQRNHAVIALLMLLLLGLAYGLVKLTRAHNHYKTAALTDRTTGLGNRRWLDSQLVRLLHRCQQQSRPAGLILFEIDQFSDLMAEHHHQSTEQALQTVSKICHHFIRHGDLFCYLENGCFAIVLPDCQPDKVMLLAEICRDAIAEPAPAPQQARLPLTASFGVSSTMTSGYSDSTLWRHADQALYLAKHHGQNRVECFSSQPTASRPLHSGTLSTDLAV